MRKKSYSSLQDFSKNTIFKDQFYQNVTTTINESLVTFEAKDPVVYDEGNPDLYDVTKCSVTIKLPFKVIEHNADVYSLKNNTYTWNISNNNVKDIKLVFDKDKIHVYNFMMYISIVILILIILILIFIVIKLKNKNKTNNQFD